jgi:hypothetical protein
VVHLPYLPASRHLDHMHTGSKVREVRIAQTSAIAVFRLEALLGG